MGMVIVYEFDCGKQIVPIVLALGSEDLKVSFKFLIKMFGLAIGLWVISY
jgi:hypothetical protein